MKKKRKKICDKLDENMIRKRGSPVVGAGNKPSGCPELSTSVCSSVIIER